MKENLLSDLPKPTYLSARAKYGKQGSLSFPLSSVHLMVVVQNCNDAGGGQSVTLQSSVIRFGSAVSRSETDSAGFLTLFQCTPHLTQHVLISLQLHGKEGTEAEGPIKCSFLGQPARTRCQVSCR